MLGADHPLDDAAYTVQMLRLKADAQRGQAGISTRLDLAQGWWGVDNNPAPEGDTLFRNKDTSYGIHVDRAYAWARGELGGVKLEGRIGRQLWRTGHGLTLDQNVDGIRLLARPGARTELALSWGKLSEGLGSTRNPRGPLMSDQAENADADLLALQVAADLGGETAGSAPTHVQGWVLAYQDRSGEDQATYLPEGLGYSRSRFSPNLSRVLVVGASARTLLDVGAGLSLDGEANVLVGEDLVHNTDYRDNVLDINDGRISGYTVYAAAVQSLDVGVPVEIGARFGQGSGDPDPTSGRGNVTRLATMGFFPLTNVFEDSVMPDVEGISPQGLGSPVSRGYRELENTTAVQGVWAVEPHRVLRIDGSYTYLRATQPVTSWSADGPGTRSAQDLGHEVDLNVGLRLLENVQFKALSGVFLPGQASGFLIRGTDTSLEPVWELKNVVVVRL